MKYNCLTVCVSFCCRATRRSRMHTSGPLLVDPLRPHPPAGPPRAELGSCAPPQGPAGPLSLTRCMCGGPSLPSPPPSLPRPRPHVQSLHLCLHACPANQGSPGLCLHTPHRCVNTRHLFFSSGGTSRCMQTVGPRLKTTLYHHILKFNSFKRF